MGGGAASGEAASALNRGFMILIDVWLSNTAVGYMSMREMTSVGHVPFVHEIRHLSHQVQYIQVSPTLSCTLPIHTKGDTFETTLPDNAGPAIVDRYASAVDDAGSLAVSHIHTEPSHLIQITSRSLDRLIDGVHLLVALHVDTGLECIGHVGVHGAHHQGITLDTLVAVESGSVLGQPDQTVLAGGISSACDSPLEHFH